MFKLFILLFLSVADLVYANNAPPVIYIKNGNVSHNSDSDPMLPPAASSGAMQNATNAGPTPYYAPQVQEGPSQVTIPTAPRVVPINNMGNNIPAESNPVIYNSQGNALSGQVVQSPAMEDISRYETSATPLPSVSNIHEVEKSKFNNKVRNCIGANKTLEDKYAIPDIRKVITKKFNTSSPCDEITKALQEISAVYEKMQVIKNDPICNVENTDPATLSQAEVNIRKDKIEKDYNSFITTYTKYFAYNEDAAFVEMCMNYYNSFTITQEINGEYSDFAHEAETFRHIVKAHGLRGVYGENKGMSGLGLASFIEDVNLGKISISQASNYAIFEPNSQDWTLAGATDDYLVYAFDEAFIGIPLESGKSYSCDKLPYQLFIAEKKIEFPKRGYSIFMLKPLE